MLLKTLSSIKPQFFKKIYFQITQEIQKEIPYMFNGISGVPQTSLPL
jgi:hypothetical protein